MTRVIVCCMVASWGLDYLLVLTEGVRDGLELIIYIAYLGIYM
jgi:hypothetical protein